MQKYSFILGLLCLSSLTVSGQQIVGKVMASRKGSSFAIEKSIGKIFSVQGTYQKYAEDQFQSKRSSNAPIYSASGTGWSGEFRVYVPNVKKKMEGIYLGLVSGIMYHELTYREHVVKPNPSSGVLLIDLLFSSSRNTTTTFSGSKNVVSRTNGIKIGYQKHFSQFNIDGGLGFLNSTIRGDKSMVRMSNGNSRPYKEQVQGTHAFAYLGIGVSF